jgi:hypothetical protein
MFKQLFRENVNQDISIIKMGGETSLTTPPLVSDPSKGGAACPVAGMCFAVSLRVNFKVIGMAVTAFPVMTSVYAAFYFHFRSHHHAPPLLIYQDPIFILS